MDTCRVRSQFMFRHLLQSVEVARLLQTQSTVSGVFAHGPHRG